MKNILLSIIPGLILTALVSFASDIETKEKVVDDILTQGLIVNPELDTNGVIAKLGKPVRVETKPFDNPYYEKDDEITHLYYTGVEILVFTTKNLNNNWSKVSQVIISEKKKNLPYGLNIGKTKNTILQILGKPHSSDGDIWFYGASDGEPHLYLILEFNGEVLEKFIWSHMP